MSYPFASIYATFHQVSFPSPSQPSFIFVRPSDGNKGSWRKMKNPSALVPRRALPYPQRQYLHPRHLRNGDNEMGWKWRVLRLATKSHREVLNRKKGHVCSWKNPSPARMQPKIQSLSYIDIKWIRNMYELMIAYHLVIINQIFSKNPPTSSHHPPDFLHQKTQVEVHHEISEPPSGFPEGMVKRSTGSTPLGLLGVGGSFLKKSSRGWWEKLVVYY